MKRLSEPPWNGAGKRHGHPFRPEPQRQAGQLRQPDLHNFPEHGDVQQEVISAAHEIYRNYLREDMSGGKYPPYKASGMAYIRFASVYKDFQSVEEFSQALGELG